MPFPNSDNLIESLRWLSGVLHCSRLDKLTVNCDHSSMPVGSPLQGYQDECPGGVLFLNPYSGQWHWLINNWFGLAFNSPNDIVCTTEDQALWFTDPSYAANQVMHQNDIYEGLSLYQVYVCCLVVLTSCSLPSKALGLCCPVLRGLAS